MGNHTTEERTQKTKIKLTEEKTAAIVPKNNNRTIKIKTLPVGFRESFVTTALQFEPTTGILFPLGARKKTHDSDAHTDYSAAQWK